MRSSGKVFLVLWDWAFHNEDPVFSPTLSYFMRRQNPKTFQKENVSMSKENSKRLNAKSSTNNSNSQCMWLSPRAVEPRCSKRLTSWFRTWCIPSTNLRCTLANHAAGKKPVAAAHWSVKQPFLHLAVEKTAQTFLRYTWNSTKQVFEKLVLFKLRMLSSKGMPPDAFV